MGRLFIITKDSRFGYVNNSFLFQKIFNTSLSQSEKWLYQSLFNNKMLSSSHLYRNNPEYSIEFDKFWRKYAQDSIHISLDQDDITYLCPAPKHPILDFKMYAQSAFVANRDGLHEMQLSIDQNNINITRAFDKVIDSKAIGVTTRMGEILITTKQDGLFRASFLKNSKVKLYKRPIYKKSINSAWTKYNFINYEDSVNSRLFNNEVSTQNEKGLIFQIEDGSKKPLKIIKFAKESIDLENLISAKLNRESITFTFNSLSYLFIIKRNGEVFYLKVDDNYDTEYSQTSVGNFLRRLPIRVPSQYGKPLSGFTLNQGVVIEFFNHVMQYRKGQSNKIYTGQVIDLKSYPNSIRYKSLIQLNVESGIILQSTYPYI
jgi:hypothetical protein